MQTYIVQRGDTLGIIAQKFLGTSLKWREIWEANTATIPNPDIIKAGQSIKIPGIISSSPVQTYIQPEITASRPAYEPISINIDNNFIEKIKNILKNKAVLYTGISIACLLAVLFIIKKK